MDLKKIAAEYNKQFGFNVLPLLDKAPHGSWTKWQKTKMDQSEISSLNWNKFNGIGVVCGIDTLRCFDFDSVIDFAIVRGFLECLGLPEDYKWTVMSGSGKGYHIWFYCRDDKDLFKMLDGEKSYYKLDPKPAEDNQKYCDHIELRWKNCQTVVPPSLHPSGSVYKFLFSKADELQKNPPFTIPVKSVIKTLRQYCVIDYAEEPDEEKITVREKSSKKKSITYSFTEIAAVCEALKGKITDYDDWMRIGFALASLGEEGRQPFLTISRNNPEYNDSEKSLNNKFTSLVKDFRGDISIATLFEIAKLYGYQRPPKYFWIIQDNKAKLFINLLIEYLESEGFAKIFFAKDYMFIRDVNNIISEVSKVNIKDFIITQISVNSSGMEKSLILEYLLRNINTVCSEHTLECLKTIKPVFAADTMDCSYYYFKNCFIKVTRDAIERREYSELTDKIWEKQKSEHDFAFTRKRSDFQLFIENVCKRSSERINALRSAIGYLLVSYKDPSEAKAVIFTDEKISDNSSGRSGKGLVATAITQMKNVLRFDGKNFTFNKQFVFQSVDPDTQLIIFDDVKKRFYFEKLFSIITEGMTIEKKNKNELRMPFASSPKILITTNHSVEGNDDSSQDRQFVVEFSDHYNAKHKPKDDFGDLFFIKWDEEQWSCFFNYMLECCRYYLQNGLQSYHFVNLVKKKLIDSTAQEFEEYIKNVPLNKEYNKKQLFEQFKLENEDFGQMKQNTFSKWTKIYAELYNVDILERKSGMDRYITLSERAS